MLFISLILRLQYPRGIRHTPAVHNTAARNLGMGWRWWRQKFGCCQTSRRRLFPSAPNLENSSTTSTLDESLRSQPTDRTRAHAQALGDCTPRKTFREESNHLPLFGGSTLRSDGTSFRSGQASCERRVARERLLLQDTLRWPCCCALDLGTDLAHQRLEAQKEKEGRHCTHQACDKSTRSMSDIEHHGEQGDDDNQRQRPPSVTASNALSQRTN